MVTAQAASHSSGFTEYSAPLDKNSRDGSESFSGPSSSSPDRPRETSPGFPVDRYRVHVARVFDDTIAAAHQAPKRPVVFDNLGLPHAEAVIQEMLLRAFRSIKIYAHRLDKNVYDIKLLESFLSRSPRGTVQLIVEAEDVLNNPHSALYHATEFLKHPRVTVSYLPEKFRGDHVAIVDDRLLRIETCQKERTASVVVGPEEVVNNSIELFDLLVKNSVRILPSIS